MECEYFKINVLLQKKIGLLGVTFLVGCCYFVKFFRGVAFYILLIAVGIPVVLFPIDDQVAVVILIQFLTKDLQKVHFFPLVSDFLLLTLSSIVLHDVLVPGIDRNDRGCGKLANESQ